MPNIYSVYDDVSETWSPSFEAPTDRSAMRMMEEALSRPDKPDSPNTFFRHASNYNLYILGSYEPLSGGEPLALVSNYHFICNVASLKSVV